MIKLCKWVYKLGYDKAMDKVFRVLENEAQLHAHQQEIKYHQKTEDPINYDINYSTRKVQPKDHEQRLEEVYAIQNLLDPERYPDVKNFLELLR